MPVVSRTHFHPYHHTKDTEKAVGASPPHFPRSPQDFQNFSWQHKTSSAPEDEFDRHVGPSGGGESNRPAVGASSPHNPRSPADMKRPSWAEKEGYMKHNLQSKHGGDYDSIADSNKAGVSLFGSAIFAPPLSPPLTAASVKTTLRQGVSEGTFRLNPDGSMTAMQASVSGGESSRSSKGGGYMIDSSPAPPLFHAQGHVKQEKVAGRGAGSGAMSSQAVAAAAAPSSKHVKYRPPTAVEDEFYRHSNSPSTQMPPYRAGFRTTESSTLTTASTHAPKVQSTTPHVPQSDISPSRHHAKNQLSEQEDQQLKDHLIKQEKIREEQTKQWHREEEEYLVHRQIEKQREATHSSEPHSAAGAIVKASSLRIDSAYAAAQCLKASLEADMSDPATSERLVEKK
jgi:hypothetical protein